MVSMNFPVFLISVLLGIIFFIYVTFYKFPIRSYRSDLNEWCDFKFSYIEEPQLEELRKAYDDISLQIQKIDYEEYHQTYRAGFFFVREYNYRPERPFLAILNKLGFSREMEELKEKREKIKEKYLLLEKIVMPEIIKQKRARIASGERIINGIKFIR